MELRAAGDRAILAVLDRNIDASELHAAASAARTIDGVAACIPGQSSLLTVWTGAPRTDVLRQRLLTPGLASAPAPKRHHRLAVSLANALDLDEFLASRPLRLEDFMSRLAGLELTARYLGFRAGFAYLDGWPEEWSMPRRPTSRPRVEAGAFGIAGGVAGFYPIGSPGGWNILGRSDASFWDEDRVPPNLIRAGDTISIAPTLEPLDFRDASMRIARVTLVDADVLAAPLAQVVGPADWTRVDSGRPSGGPFDEAAARAANAAVGLATDSPILECAAVGPRLRMRRRCFLSWYGATADIRVSGHGVADPRQFEAKEGDEVVIARLQQGMRGYLAIGAEAGRVSQLDRSNRTEITIVPGPDHVGIREFTCEVTTELNRVGIRMRPLTAVSAAIPADLPSCGMQPGTIQLHPDGTIVAIGPDHPVTGGYLQPATVVSTELWKLAQLAPGDRVRFVG